MIATPKRPSDLTAKVLRALLHYDPVTGAFTWAAGVGNRRAGQAAGTPDGLGYLRVMIDKRNYRLHRLALLYVHGEWPPQQVDHINGNRSDNRFANLRAATPALNSENQRRAKSDSLLGLLGVSRCRKLYFARIKVAGKGFHLGSYATAEAAHAAYIDAKRVLHEGGTL